MASAQGGSRHRECAMCMEVFTSPRLLPCFHTFCLACLQRLVQTRPTAPTFPCPTCRTPVTIPPGGVEKFQVNFYIEAEVEGQGQGSSRTVRVCDMCQKQPVTHKCSDCDQFACDTCTAIHASIAATRSHTVLQLKDLKGPGQSQSKVTKERFCVTHTEEKIRFFCNQCCRVICRDCKLTSHEGHNTTDLSAKSSEAKQLILKVTKLSRENLEPKLRQQLEKAGDHQKKLQDKKQELQALLEKRAEELKEKIDQSLSQAKQKLEQETGSLNNTAAACLDAMNMELAGFLSLTEHAERVAQGGCQADILEIPGLMKQFLGHEEDQGIGWQPSFCHASKQKHSKRKLKKGRGLATRVAQDEEQVPHKFPCKLKSFMDSRWKVTVQMEEEDKNKMIACDGCGYRYAKNVRFCPSCGNDATVQTEEEDNNMIVCIGCGDFYAKNVRFCPSCGSDATVQMEEEDNMIVCIGCGFRYDKNGRFCPSCGKDATVQMQEKELYPCSSVSACIDCGIRYADHFRFCPSCGNDNDAEQDLTYCSRLVRAVRHTPSRPVYASHLESSGPSCGQRDSDSKATIEKAISDYIGGVKVNSETAEALTSQIANDVATLQSCLSGWRCAY